MARDSEGSASQKFKSTLYTPNDNNQLALAASKQSKQAAMATTSLPPSAVASSSAHAVVASGSTVHLVTGDKVASASSAEDAKQELAGVIRKVAISADGKYAVTAGDDKSLRVWELKEKPELVSTRQTTKRVADMCFDKDGNIVVTDKVGDVFR